jgi:ABC-type dipeptide/oligopeptide/nickel transport system ATPase subunit
MGKSSQDKPLRPVTARENPFATCHVEHIPFRFPPGMGWESLLKRLEELNWCASIVGGNGSGKTTLLEQLIPHLQQRGFEPIVFRLQTESGMKEKDRLADKLREVRSPGFILLDGAEQLSTRQWLPIRAAASQAAGFIVTVHRTSRLPVALELETSSKLLENLVESLTGGKLPDAEADALFHRHRGNLRECLRELYDRWAG